MLRTERGSTRSARGFTLVELMVAMVVGLIVIGAVLALVLSIMQSNRQTLQATRLNQELRATLAVIASDLRRARSVTDPLTTAKATDGNPYKDVDTSTPGCISYGYDGAIGGPWHVIRHDTQASKVILAGAATEGAATCDLAGEQLGSDQVNITSLTFEPLPAGGTTSTSRRFAITIAGSLDDNDPDLAAITRTMTQTVFVRSIGDGN